METGRGFSLKMALLIAAVIAGLALADQYTKGLVERRMTLGQGIAVIPGFFDVVYVRNRGAAFGILSGVDSAWVQRGFTAFTLLAMAALVNIYRSFPPDERLGRVAVVMIGSGAVGNLIDRVQRGSVTDFLSFHIGQYQWPAFNLADSLITVGVCFLAYALIFHPQAPEAGRNGA
jgi:signal peptidase II